MAVLQHLPTKILYETKASRFPRPCGLLRRTTFLFLRSNCETTVDCCAAATCSGVNDCCGTAWCFLSYKYALTRREQQQSARSLRWSTAVCPYLTRITFPLQSFNEKERLSCTTVLVLKYVTIKSHNLPTANIYRWSYHTSVLEKGVSYHLGQAIFLPGIT